ncbi:MAG: hypothetical protein IT312_06420 [Anaerolineales bacterium]|nr:hypothetical protein [Anaerolineales bacterium]
MKKTLKMFLVVIGGVFGTCTVIWFASTTAENLQEASARSETVGIVLAATLFIGIGLLIVNYFRKK